MTRLDRLPLGARHFSTDIGRSQPFSSSTNRANLASNLQAQRLNLDDAEMAQITALDRCERLTSPEGLAPAWD